MIATPHTAPPASEVTASEAGLLALIAERREHFLAFVRSRVRTSADADDLLQQALLKATTHLHTLRQGDRVDAWFYRVLRNTIADHHVALARTEARLEQLAREASDGPDVEAAVCGCSLGLLEKLSGDHAAILRLVDLEELPLFEAAHALGITANNAKVRLHRARKALRESLRSMCGTDSLRACMSCGCD